MAPLRSRRPSPAARKRRTALLAGAVVLAAPAVWAGSVNAAAGCTSTIPALDETVTCLTAGTETVTVPAGSSAVVIVADGAGGAGGGKSSLAGTNGGDGGSGARVEATLPVTGVATLTLTVGAEGTSRGIGNSGNGGGSTSVQAGSQFLVVAAGGGGGGAENGGVAGGAGGSGGEQGAAGANAGSAGGGGGGNSTGSGLGGSGGTGSSSGSPGTSSYSGTGGAGGGFSNNSGGWGGGGFGGGGGGAFDGGAAGGGGGGSFVDPSSTSTTFTSGGGGAGGAGATSNSSPGANGMSGGLTLRFVTSSDGPTSEAPEQPRYATLQVDGGATCSPSFTGTSGTWIQLLRQSCTAPAIHPGAVLLGWSTSASFPVPLAQHQVDAGWGVIDEIIEGERKIFIPVNGFALLSYTNTLYPVWSLP